MTDMTTQDDTPDLALLLGEHPAEIAAARVADTATGIYVQWAEDGTLSDLEAVRLLAPELRIAERVMDAAQARVDAIKGYLRDVYTRSGEKVLSVPEFDLALTARQGFVKATASVPVVRGAIGELRASGEAWLVEWADRLEAAIKETPVAGGVTVGRFKQQ